MAGKEEARQPAEPTEAYYKAKRSLMFFVACLLLAVFVGFKIPENGQRIAVLPFELTRPEWLSGIFFVVVLFNAFQFSLHWAAQMGEVQLNRFYRLDYLSIISITIFSLLSYLAYFALLSFGLSLPSWSWTSIIFTGFFIAVAGLFSFSAAMVVRGLAEILGRQLKAMSSARDARLADTVKRNRWILVYDPKVKGAKKQITFGIDGFVDHGRNENEYRWQVRDGLLEIFTKADEIHSRFLYDGRKNEFLHTNDEDTKSKRSQRMYADTSKQNTKSVGG
jgi:hypothetical protein